MKTINEISLLDILPSSIRDDEKVIAVAKSLDVELQKLSLQTKLPLHLPRLNELDHDVLNELAWQYDAIFFEPENMTLEVKRQIVANSIKQWRTVGTPYAVRQMLDNFAKGTQIQEWFEYGGEPYHFKLLLKELRDLDDNGETIMRLINSTKNVRSWIDAFDFDLTKDVIDKLFVGIMDLQQGNFHHDLTTDFEHRHKVYLIHSDIESGEVKHDLSYSNCGGKQILRAGIFEIVSGTIKHTADFEVVDDDLWYRIWLAYIRSRWKAFDPAVIHYYRDEPIDDDDPEPVESEFNGQYLKLWIQYHNSDLSRLIVLPFPRDDLTGADINNVNVDGIFVKRGYLSDKIYRAVYVDKTRHKLEF